MGKGPTSDYRTFKGALKGRNARFYRLFMNNFTSMMGKTSTIVVMAISYFFVFFSLIFLALSGQTTEISEPTVLEGKMTFFEIAPEDPDDVHIASSLGETISVVYELKNIGKDPDGAELLITVPNGEWTYSVEPASFDDIPPGGSRTFTLSVTLPDTREHFSERSGSDLFLLLRTLNKDVPSGPMPGKAGEEASAEKEAVAEAEPLFYRYNTTRGVGIVVVPSSIVGSMMEGDGLTLDPRVSSAALIVSIVDAGTEGGGPWVSFEEDGDPVHRVRMGSSGYYDLALVLGNPGTRPMTLYFDHLLMPWSGTFSGSLMETTYDQYGNQYVNLDPMTEGGYWFSMYSGYYGFEKTYNMLLVVTDIRPDGSHATNATMLSVHMDAPREQSEGQKYYDILWGGGFNYNRYLWIILFASVCGAPLISNDLKNNSLALYFSRPLTWKDYLLGKAAAMFAGLSVMTLPPAILLFFVGAAFSKDSFTFIFEQSWILLAMIGSYVISLSIFTSVSLMFSTLTKKGMFAGVSIFSFFIFTSAVSDILRSLFETDRLKLLNINLVMRSIFRTMFGMTYHGAHLDVDWYVPVLILIGLIAVPWLVMIVRFRNREVVK